MLGSVMRYTCLRACTHRVRRQLAWQGRLQGHHAHLKDPSGTTQAHAKHLATPHAQAPAIVGLLHGRLERRYVGV